MTVQIPRFDPTLAGYHAGHPEQVLVGPPGTGKTRQVLDAWVLPALADGAPEEVLACSFTRAAAGEMQDRVSSALPLPEYMIKRVCKTIHSEARRLVLESGRKVLLWKPKLAKRGMLVAEYEAQLRAQALKAAGLQGEEEESDDDAGDRYDADEEREFLFRPSNDVPKEAERIWALIRLLWYEESKDMRRLPGLAQRLAYSYDVRGRLDELISQVRTYVAMKESVGAMDFTDMLGNALDTCTAPSRRIIVVDEAQDLSPLQIRLVRRWAEEADQLVWVGDPDQAIYGWAGADGEHLTSLIQDDEVLVNSLQQSWRVPVQTHELARRTILMNRDRVDAPYEPAARAGAVWVASQRSQGLLLAAEQAQSGSVFILARTTQALNEWAQMLAGAGIPFRNERGGSPVQAPRRVALVAAIESLLQGLRIPLDQARTLLKATPAKPPRHRFLAEKKKTVGAALARCDTDQLLSVTDLIALGFRADLLQALGSARNVLESIDKAEDVEPLLRIIEVAEGDWRVITRPPSITLTTLHGSKGRESDTVVMDLTSAYPITLKLQQGRDVEAERRLLYVGFTRAINTLCVYHRNGDLADLLRVDL